MNARGDRQFQLSHYRVVSEQRHGLARLHSENQPSDNRNNPNDPFEWHRLWRI